MTPAEFLRTALHMTMRTQVWFLHSSRDTNCWRGTLQPACLGLLLGLFGEQDGLNVGQHTTLSDGDAGEKLVELLVISDGKLQVPGNDAGLLVVTGRVSGQLEHFGGQVLQDGGQVDRSAGTDALGVVSLPQQAVNTTHRELQPGTTRAGLALPLDFATLAATRHSER